MSLVDRDQEEKIIVEIEQIFKKYDLMPDEKMFILTEVIGRINRLREEQKMSDLMSSGMNKDLMKSIQKKFFKGDDEE